MCVGNHLYACQAKPATDGSLPFTSNTVYSGKNDGLISKVWSGCSGRLMRRNQESNQEQLK